jgi:hypothetical protein
MVAPDEGENPLCPSGEIIPKRGVVEVAPKDVSTWRLCRDDVGDIKLPKVLDE